MGLSHLSPQNHEIQSINTKASFERTQNKGGFWREAKYSEVSLEQNPEEKDSERRPNGVQSSLQTPKGTQLHRITSASHKPWRLFCKPHGCNSISIKLSNQVCPIPIILRLQFECSKCVMYYEWVKPMPWMFNHMISEVYATGFEVSETILLSMKKMLMVFH